MKTKVLLLLLLTITINAKLMAQLSGTKTVGGTSPDYATIGIAIDSLNMYGAGLGGVTFLVAAGHTETLINKAITTTTSSVTNPVVFVKSGAGANPLVTAGAGTSTTIDYIIGIVGADYITIDGIDLVDPVANTTTTTRIEFGYGIFKQNTTNGCEGITITNCNITLQKLNTTSIGIKVANHTNLATTALIISNPSGINKNINITNNNITNCYTGIFQIGATAVLYYDEDITITNNVITNFGGSSVTCYGIYGIYYKNINISNDSINGGTANTGIVYGIFTTTATGATININNNFVRLITSATTNAMYPIYNTGGATSGNLTITNNTVDGCSNTTQTTGLFYAIFNGTSVINANISNNRVTNNTRSSSTGATYLIYTSSGTNINVFNNIVSNNTINSTSTAIAYLVYTNGVNINVFNNEITNNQRLGGTGTTLSGIYISSATVYRIYGNKIGNLNANFASATINGIHIAAGSDVIVHNNIIGNLTAPISTTNNGVNGINITGTSTATMVNLIHNSIFLNASSTGTNFGSNGIFVNTGPTVELSNNLVVNNSTATGTGRTVAFRRSSTAIGSYNNKSNNNLFYAGTPGTLNLIYSDNTNSFQTLNDYQTYLNATNRDQSSVTENVSFLSTTTTSNDFLKINSITATQAEAGGRLNTDITTDFTGSANRTSFPLTSQINGGGQFPDIGAYELDLIPSDVSGPEITYKRLRSGTVGVGRWLNNVFIIDKSGIDTAYLERPRLYFRKTSNANMLGSTNDNTTDGWKYAVSNISGNNYSFFADYSLLYGGSPIVNDTIEYFVIAADKSTMPNVRINNAVITSSATNVNLGFGNFPILSSNSYLIDTALNAVYFVGGSGIVDFTSLTRADGLFAAINNNVVTSNIEVNIVSDITDENGAIALTELAQDGPNIGNNIITIKSNSGPRFIGGSLTSPLFKFNNTSNVVIDGDFFGTPYNLTFANTSTTGTLAVFHFIGTNTADGCSNITIANCNIYTGNRINTASYGIFIGNTTLSTSNASGGFFNNKIRLINNNIYKVYSALAITSSPTSYADSILILNNKFGSDTVANYIGSYGLRINGLNQGSIKGNKIYNIVSTSTTATNLYGIHLAANVRNTILDGNEIDHISYTATQYNATRAISITGTPNANVLLKNNIIKRVISSGADNSIFYGPTGIYFDGTGSNYKVYNNSVHLSGHRPLNSWVYSSSYTYNLRNAYTAAMAINSSAISGLDVRNNVFSNVLTTALTTQFGFNFAIYSSTPATNFSVLSHNLYHASSATNGVTNGMWAAATYTTLPAFRNVLTLDKYSLFAQPGFTATLDLTPNLNDTSVWNMSGRGIPLPEVSNDFMGNNRNTALINGAIDLGAYEFSQPLVMPSPAMETTVPVAGASSAYLIGQDTVAVINWTPFTSVPTGFVLRYYPGVNPPSPTPGSKYMNAYWDMDGSPNSNISFETKLFYSPANIGTIASESNTIGANYYANAWSHFPTLSAIDLNKKTLTINSLANLGIYTGTDALNPLPVKLVTFTVNKNNGDALINWSTSSEVNTSNFVIEKSVNGKLFNEVGSTKARGNSNKLINYSFTDKDAVINALNDQINQLYYRLKVNDKDGKVSYSDVRLLDLNSIESEDYKLWPNPFVDNLNLKVVNTALPIQINIVDINGKEVFNQTFNNNTEMLNIVLNQNIPNGIYLITIKTNGVSKTHKLLKTL